MFAQFPFVVFIISTIFALSDASPIPAPSSTLNLTPSNPNPDAYIHPVNTFPIYTGPGLELPSPPPAPSSSSISTPTFSLLPMGPGPVIMSPTPTNTPVSFPSLHMGPGLEMPPGWTDRPKIGIPMPLADEGGAVATPVPSSS